MNISSWQIYIVFVRWRKSFFFARVPPSHFVNARVSGCVCVCERSDRELLAARYCITIISNLLIARALASVMIGKILKGFPIALERTHTSQSAPNVLFISQFSFLFHFNFCSILFAAAPINTIEHTLMQFKHYALAKVRKNGETLSHHWD